MTFGHGTLDRDSLAELITAAQIQRVVDVRRFPGSRANEAAAREAIPALLAEIGVDYRWDERLGGRRHLNAEALRESPDSWWQVDAFRAYAAWTRTDEFRAGLAELIADVDRRSTAVMCSESVWWRCHRRLISDVMVIEQGIDVRHLMHDGRLVEHRPSDGAQQIPGDGRLVWDANLPT